METDLNETPLPESIPRIPYDDMEPLHDWGGASEMTIHGLAAPALNADV
ncbi:MAG: hypothetical protein II889_10675 [Clostridia bacterium]|nr:hypothetical protein [Clostridia bacterium]